MAPPSKACDQCRRRRVRCDKNRPRCFRCVKAKLTCGGYRPFEVIRYECNVVKGKRKLRQTPTGSGADADTDTDPDADSPIESSLQLFQRSSPSAYQSFSPSTTALSFLHCLQVDPESNYQHYTYKHLFGSGFDGSSMPAEYALYGDLSKRSYIALSTYFFGNEHGDRAIIAHGLKLYGNAIKDLNGALGDQNRRRSFDVFGAVELLSTFEVCPDIKYLPMTHTNFRLILHSSN